MIAGLLGLLGCDRHDGGPPPHGPPSADSGATEPQTATTGDTGLAAPLAEGVRWTGREELDEAGSIVDVGQADSDPQAEALINAPTQWLATATSSHATVHVVDGDTQPGQLEDVSVVTFTGGANGDDLGLNLALVGDVTGDSIPDAAINSNYDSGTGISVCVFSLGDLAGTVPASIAAATSCVQYDVSLDEGAGRLGDCGDLDGNGVADLCVGFYNLELYGDSGVIFVPGPIPTGIIPFEDATRLRVTDSSWAGEHLIGHSDLTGDGRDDLLVTAPYRQGGVGGIYLVSEIPPGTTELDDHPVWTGDEPLSNLGDSVAVGGDMDGDGLPDAFLGAHTSHDRQGRGYVATDKDGGPAADSFAVFAGAADLDWMGVSAAFGDFDGDGHDDFAIGLPGDSFFADDRPGEVAVYRGPLAPGTRTQDDADLLFRASDAADGFGLRMDAGDLDGDGLDDLVVGAQHDDGAALEAGAVYYLRGGEFGL